MVEAADLDEALALAGQVPAPFGGVEVRPIRTFDWLAASWCRRRRWRRGSPGPRRRSPWPGSSTGLALILLTDSRRATRVDGDGRLQLLADQDRRRWDHSEIEEGLDLVRTALPHRPPGRFVLMAAIAAVPAGAPSWSSAQAQLLAEAAGTPKLIRHEVAEPLGRPTATAGAASSPTGT